MSLFRGFIAIDITSTPQMITFEKEIVQSGADVKLVEPENIHITLKFLGDTEENSIDTIKKKIQESVQGLTPFQITLKGTGVFPNQNYMKVLWIGIIDAGSLQIIARTIDTLLVPLGFRKETRGFSPHLTIGRVKSAKNKDKLLRVLQRYNEMEFLVQEVDSIVLKKSELTPQGPIYTTLREVRL